MKNYWLIILIFVLALSGNSCKKDSNPYRVIRDSKYKKAIIDSRKEVGFHMFQADMPGLSVAVFHKNKLVWSEGMGYANKELKVPASPETKFRVGGVSKLFTGALVARLVEAGQVNLTSPIQEYDAELPKDKGQLNFVQLFSQSSGLRAPTYQEDNYQGYYTIQKGIEVFINDSLLFYPGEYVNESNYNYDLLGAVLEAKTGKNFQEILKENLTDTMHLATTTTDSPITLIDNRSQCYDRSIVARTIRSFAVDNRHRAASVGLLSSALDMARLMNEYLHPVLFKEETVQKILTPFKLENGIPLTSGLGVTVVKDNLGRDLYLAMGSTKGGSASVIAYPELDFVVAIACNITGEGENLPVFKIAGHFIENFDPRKKEKKETENAETNSSEAK